MKAPRNFLTEFYEESGKEVKCLPKFKVTENALVVGFLTSSNQFVKIDPPREMKDVQDEIEEFNDYKQFDVDKMLDATRRRRQHSRNFDQVPDD